MVREYQKVCSEVITRFDEHIAQLLGGWSPRVLWLSPRPEDDAQRAVRTGLGILAAMGDLNTRLQQDKGIQLALRMGIHTGLVVVGEMGGAGRQEQLALGEVPNIASRIEGLAAPNTMAVSEATYRLVQGYFDCQDLGEQTLRGVLSLSHVYRVLRESGATVALMWLRPEDSHRWLVESQKSRSSWNVGSKSKLGKGTWSYSRVMQALGSPGWSKC